MTTFSDLGVPARLVRALAERGVTAPFPIQAATLPDALAGRDVLGRGRTGSGKTYAFALPVLARLAASGTPRRPGRPRALILAPTRELAGQIDAALAPLAAAVGLRSMVVFGGVGAKPQIDGLRRGVDVLVACPGRLEDHLRGGHVHLDAVEVTVLDEADHMADLGFLPAVSRLLAATPRGGQRLLFSATLDAGVDVLVRRFLRDPVTHHVDPAAQPPVEMAHHVLHVHPDDRLGVLVDLLAAPGRTVVFTRTKRRAKTLTRQLVAAGVPAVELHGNLGQGARDRNLAAFSGGTAPTLVATDIAARGIHVDDVGLVVHADPPVEHKAYLHRSGRTARAGARGTVVTLTTDDQRAEVRDLARKAGIDPVVTRARPGDAVLSELAPGERTLVAAPAAADAAPAATGGRGRRGGGAEPAAAGAPGGSGRSRRARRRPAGRGTGADGRGATTTTAGRGAAAGQGRQASGASGRQAAAASGRQPSGASGRQAAGASGRPAASASGRPAGRGVAAFSAGTRLR